MGIRTATSDIVRRATVAGYWYPAERGELERVIDQTRPAGITPRAARAAIVPHGSYARCGRVLGSTLGQLDIPRRCVILGASHTSTWIPWSVLSSGSYRTPLGDVDVDTDLARRLQQRYPMLQSEGQAQIGEHAVEALLPFLQRFGPAALLITPVIIGSDDAGEIAQFAGALAEVVRDTAERVLLIASTDLTHFQAVEQARIQDRALIERLCALESDALIRHVQDAGGSMCGYAAAAAVTEAAKQLGARRGTLMQYATSADADGDPDSVIGYAGIIMD